MMHRLRGGLFVGCTARDDPESHLSLPFQNNFKDLRNF
jgi:hypothetical protein